MVSRYVKHTVTVIPFECIHSLLHPLLLVANVPCRPLGLSFQMLFYLVLSIRAKSLRSPTLVRLGLPHPRLSSSLPSIVLSRVT